jgi:hypothetical protein
MSVPRGGRSCVFEIVEAIHKAIRTDSTWAFVSLIAVITAVAGLAWLVDRGCRNFPEYMESHPNRILGLVVLIRKATRPVPTWAFVSMVAVIFGAVTLGVGWLVDKGYRNPPEYPGSHRSSVQTVAGTPGTSSTESPKPMSQDAAKPCVKINGTVSNSSIEGVHGYKVGCSEPLEIGKTGKLTNGSRVWDIDIDNRTPSKKP